MCAKILVIDDSITNVHIFKMILEKENHTIFASYDGQDVISLITKHNIDIVLLDIIMPKISGYDILQNLQNLESTKDIPVIMITCLTSAENVKKALEYGALDYIRKPFEPVELSARIHSALRLKQKQDLLKEFAQTDPLTKLYNRRYFDEAIENILAKKDDYPNGVALVTIDLDYFKTINDCYGHAAGDEVLSATANAMAKSVKAKDILCRTGGEEFSLILLDVTPFQSSMVAERLRSNVQKMRFVFQKQSITVTISCGISHTKPGDIKTSQLLTLESDSALYASKKGGRNRTEIFQGDMLQAKPSK